AERFHLAISDGADAQVSFSLVNLERDGGTLDRNDFADELDEIRNGSSLFARVNTEQRLFLLLCRSFIHMNYDAPIPFEDVAGNVSRKAHRQTRDIDDIDVSLSILI